MDDHDNSEAATWPGYASTTALAMTRKDLVDADVGSNRYHADVG